MRSIRCLAKVRNFLLLVVAIAGCSAPPADETPDAGALDASADAAIDTATAAGFGELSGMCGVLTDAELTSPSPLFVRAAIAFARPYVDPTDRPLLTPGGQHLAETPNAGGSSGLSEIFAYEQLARCELAPFLKTETEIVYDTPGKITDLLVEIDGHKIGVSVTRAVTYPFGQPYTLQAATTLLTRKLEDIQASSLNVSAADRWEKQILAYIAWDDLAADVVEQAWVATSAAIKADTIVIVTVSNGEDTFIYTNQ